MSAVRVVIGVVVVVCLVGALAPAASAEHVGCGAVILTDTTLDSDVTGCPGIAISSGAGNVTLDLAGHTVSSTDNYVIRVWHDGFVLRNGTVDSLGRACSVFATAPHGGLIRDIHTHDVCIDHASGYLVTDVVLSGGIGISESTGNVVRDVSAVAPARGYSVLVAYSSNTLLEKVRGATVAMWSGEGNVLRDSEISDYCYSTAGSRHMYLDNHCAGGIQLDGTDDATIAGNTVSKPEGYGIASSYNHGVRIARNTVTDSVVGIQLYDSSDGWIERNHVTGNLFGILLAAASEGNLLAGNMTHRNGDDGIDVRSSLNSLEGNHANHNGDLGINAAAGNIDLGKNKAHGNGNPAQCVGVRCN
jgi:parallel beta-helix repeat protein